MVKDYDTHMWIIVQEEAGELIQAISKLLRFGPGMSCNGTGPTNEEQVLYEYYQLVGMMEKQIETENIPTLSCQQIDDIKQEKRVKVDHYYNIAIKENEK